ncbi:MAG: serine/threonine-protein kinase [Candidatus Margulisiibacteriota bacterium]|nr:serine/threonine-protein kinase [Candidatus Margulisiibacteriota bacterium]
MIGRYISPVRLNQLQKKMAPPKQQRNPFSQRHPKLFQLLTAPLWMIMGTVPSSGGPKAPDSLLKGNPNISVSGEINTKTGATTTAPHPPAKTTMKVDPLPPPGQEAKVAEIDQAITNFSGPKLAGKWKALIYALPIAIGAALPFVSVFASVGIFFPLILGKSAAAAAGVLVGSNALLGAILGGITHFAATKIIKSKAEKVIYDAFTDNEDILAKALLPYTRADGRPKTTEAGTKVTELFIPEHREKLDAAVDRAVTGGKTAADEIIPLDSMDLPQTGGVDQAAFDYSGTLSHYKELGVIGKGGMGEVLLVENVTGHKYALKVSTAAKGAISESEESKNTVMAFLQRAWLEFTSGKKIKHPNICSTVDTNIDVKFPNITRPEKFKHTFEISQLKEAGDIFIVTEFVPDKPGSDDPAPNLDGIAKTGLTHKRAIKLFAPVIDALSYAHQHDIYHRDIKPKNLVLTKDAQGKEKVVIIDFGIAKDTTEATLTAGQHVVGSPYYMAPYAYSVIAKTQKGLNALIDIYELGITMLECITGENPLKSLKQSEFYMKYLVNPGEPKYQAMLQKALEDIPLEDIPHEGLRKIVTKMISHDPEHNFHSMADVSSAFKPLSGSNGKTKTEATPRTPGSFAPAAFEPTAMQKVPEEDALAGQKPAKKGVEPRPSGAAIAKRTLQPSFKPAAPKAPEIPESTLDDVTLLPKAGEFDLQNRASVITYMLTVQQDLFTKPDMLTAKDLQTVVQNLSRILAEYSSDPDVQLQYPMLMAKVSSLVLKGGPV